MIVLKELIKKYNKGSNFFRTVLCRPEFNQFRTKDGFFVFDDSDDFHKTLKNIINLKKIGNKKWESNLVLSVIFLLLGFQPAFCQRYEPVIIYDQYGEPSYMLKGKVIYNNYGLPKNIHLMDDIQNKPLRYYIGVRTK